MTHAQLARTLLRDSALALLVIAALLELLIRAGWLS